MLILKPLHNCTIGQSGAGSDFEDEFRIDRVDELPHETENKLNKKLGFSTLLATMNPGNGEDKK